MSNTILLAFCEPCGQMTNHIDGKCISHKPIGYNPADHFTLKGWNELGKLTEVAPNEHKEKKG